MKIKILLVASLICTTSFIGCQKGNTGPTGASGANGNTNVHSYTFTVNTLDWLVAQKGYYYADIPFSQITQDIVDNGTVSMFYSLNSTGTNWIALPSAIVTSTLSLYYGFNYSLGNIRVYAENSTNGIITFPNPTYYKSVIISGTLRKLNPHTNWNNYNEVIKLINENTEIQLNVTNTIY